MPNMQLYGRNMQKLQRGDKGYIEYRKKSYMIKTFASIGAGALIFLIGLLFNKMEATNVFTVLAILMVLPMARGIVGVVVLWPYHGADLESYKTVSSKVREGMKLYADVVMTSPEKSMNLDYIVEIKGSVIGLVGKKNQDVTYIQSYLTKGIRNWCSEYKVKLYTDTKQFLKAMDELNPKEIKEEEQKQVIDYLNSLIVE